MLVEPMGCPLSTRTHLLSHHACFCHCSGPGSYLAAGPAGSVALAEQQEAVVVLRQILLWERPLRSASALGFGLYFILLVAYIPVGKHGCRRFLLGIQAVLYTAGCIHSSR